MSGISSIGSSASAASYSPLDKNQDGVVDAQELQEAAQSGLLSASILNDEDSDSSSSATDAFSGNLASMLLQMQQNSTTGSNTSSSSDGTSDQSQSPIDQ
ncbi:MAG: EF-hand domain-containing protein, partial [Rhizobiaceae bacterium]|nr:EF-hand domain-containing protein [Rhizobiaceae bacterium]